MKCAKCGADLKVGCIYCSVCGQEAQIVPDYNLMEDDLLRELLQEDGSPKRKKRKSKDSRPMQSKDRKKKQIVIFISGAAVIIAILAVLLTVWLVQRKKENTYAFQYEKGEACLAKKDYTKAAAYFERALELDKTSLEARWKIVETELELTEEDAAISMLHELIDLDSADTKAYRQLIALYRNRGDIDAILKLRDDSIGESEEVLELFAEFEVEAPEFSMKPGIYSEYIEVELQAESGCEIYYTVNGSDPAVSGTRYQEALKLEKPQELSIRAVARNSYGIYSEEMSGIFEVKFKKPKMPTVHPDGGSYTEPVSITIDVPEGAKVYYTWDDSTPSAESEEYSGPFEAPEGNNILSLILVDKYGMSSEVLKCNFKYMP